MLALSLLLAACGGKGDNRNPAGEGGTDRFGSQQVGVVGDASGLTLAPGSIKGTGNVIFSSQALENRSGTSYALDIASIQDGGSVTLVSYGDSFLGNGFEIEFRRQGTGQGSLKVTLRAQGEERNTVNRFGLDVFGAMDASFPLKLQIDIHNNESPTHVLIWSRAIADDFSESMAILNTEELEKSGGAPQANGNGTRWGLRLVNAEVSSAEPSAPKFEE